MNELLGIWLESLGESPALANRDEMRAALLYSKQAGITDVYLQVYREGRAWFSSAVASQEHLKPRLDSGYDPLAEAVALASQHGIRLHAWINVFNLGLNSAAKVLCDRGGEILLTDNCGVRLDAYSDEGRPPGKRSEHFVLDAPKLWLDPAAPAVKDYLDTLVQELFSAYPGFSGLHLDFFRYPYFLPMQPSSRIGCGFELGYGAKTLQRFTEFSARPAGFRKDEFFALRPVDEAVSLLWDRWRRAEVEGYLERFRKLLPQAATLSVAAVAWPDRAFFTAYQNWRRWISEEIVDQVCLMAYTADDELFSFLIRQACVFQTERSVVIAGSGAYLHSGAEQLASQIHAAEQAGAKGALIFSYENLRKRGISSSMLSDALAQHRRVGDS